MPDRADWQKHWQCHKAKAPCAAGRRTISHLKDELRRVGCQLMSQACLACTALSENSYGNGEPIPKVAVDFGPGRRPVECRQREGKEETAVLHANESRRKCFHELGVPDINCLQSFGGHITVTLERNSGETISPRVKRTASGGLHFWKYIHPKS